MTIQARSIYADPNKTYRFAGDAPEGCVFAYRYHDGGRQYKIGQPWPEFTPGQEIEIETTNHYVWVGRVESRVDEDTIVFRPTGPKVAADKAAKLAATWAAKEKVRSLEHSLKVARQDLDYGGRPEAIPGLESELAAARKAAGIK